MTFKVGHAQRFFATTMSSNRVLNSISGLNIYSNFLSQLEEKDLQGRVMALHQKILSSWHSSPIEKSNTSAPSYYWSDKVVNAPIKVVEEGDNIIGQHFEKHSMESHKWTVFEGNQNIPWFIKNGILSQILKLREVQAFKQAQPLDWTFTLNTYGILNECYYLQERPIGAETMGGQRVADLKDDMTMIYSSGVESEFQIRSVEWPSQLKSYPSNNSLVIVKKEDCLDKKFYVKPLVKSRTQPLQDKAPDSIGRIDLVFSCSIAFSIDVEKARSLIFGKRNYSEFSQEEKSLVNQYQEGMGGIWPNTAIYLDLVKAKDLIYSKGYPALTDEEKAFIDKYDSFLFPGENPARMI